MNPPGLPAVENAIEEAFRDPALLPSGVSLIEKAIGWIGEQLNRLFAMFVSQSGTLNVWGWVFLGIILGLLVFGVCKIVARARRNGEGSARVSRKAMSQEAEKPSAAQLWQEAVAAEGEGDLESAWSLLLAALIAAFSESGAVTPFPGKTNREFYYELKRGGRQEAEFFGAFCQAFYPPRFGGRASQKEEFGVFRDGARPIVFRERTAA